MTLLHWLLDHPIKFDEPMKLKWDIVIILLAVWNSLFIPLTLAFPEYEERYKTNPYYQSVEIISTILYIFDIFLQIRTTYINQIGEEITDNKKIAM